MAPHQLSVGHICRRGSPSSSGFPAAAEDLGAAASVTMQSPTLAMGMLLRLLEPPLRQNRPLPQEASSSSSSSSSLPLLLLSCSALVCLEPPLSSRGCKLAQLGRPVHYQPPEITKQPMQTRQQAGNYCVHMPEVVVQYPANLRIGNSSAQSWHQSLKPQGSLTSKSSSETTNQEMPDNAPALIRGTSALRSVRSPCSCVTAMPALKKMTTQNSAR